MEAYKQITLDEWTQWKEDIRRKLAETASNFVYIGYRLKQIRDSGMYDGAVDIFEFAEKEYGLGKSTVSRFIAINEKYSEGGNSLELKEEFRGFSSSKLAEMLTLPDEEIQLITERTTVREIRELKNFNAQDSEELEEAESAEAGQARTPLEKCLIDFFETRKEILNGVMKCLEADQPEYKQATEMMAPSGQASHKKGIVFLFLYDWNTGIKYKLMTEPEPVSMSWSEFLNIVYHIFGECDQADVWGDFYKEQESIKEEEKKTAPIQSIQGSGAVATSQQEGKINEEERHAKESSEGENVEGVERPVESVPDVVLTGDAEREDRCLKDKDEQEAAGIENEEGRENKAQGEDSADGTTDRESSADTESGYDEDGAGGGCGTESSGGGADCEGETEVAPVQPENEQIKGQMVIQDYPEYMPDNQEKSAEMVDMGNSVTSIIDSDGMRQHIENQKKQITKTLQKMNLLCGEENWNKLVELSREVITRAESIKNMMEVWNG